MHFECNWLLYFQGKSECMGHCLQLFLSVRRLDANEIASVPGSSFRGLASLRHLWLDDNTLTEVPIHALAILPTLQAVTLALNSITHIPDHAFANLTSLVVLWVAWLDWPTVGCYIICFCCLRGSLALSVFQCSLFSTFSLFCSYAYLLPFYQCVEPCRALLGLHTLLISFHASLPRHLHNNQIQSLGDRCFDGLLSLETLWVHLYLKCTFITLWLDWHNFLRYRNDQVFTETLDYKKLMN